MHYPLCLSPISLLEQVFFVVDFDRLFFIWETKKWSLVAWSSYAVTIVREFAGADSALVVLDEWLSYRGGRLNRFDCSALS